MEMSQLTPRRPHLLRALYGWLLENQLTPHLLVDINLPGVRVPLEYALDGQIVLNIAPRAVGKLELGNDEVCFTARFGGVPCEVTIPMAAVLAIYGRENGAGTLFEPEPAYYDADPAAIRSEAPETIMTVIDGDRPDASDPGDDDNPDNNPPPRGGRPLLRVIK